MKRKSLNKTIILTNYRV